MAHNYILQVTTGTEYDVTTHKIVPVNAAGPVKIESELLEAEVNVRIQNYRGLPKASPSTSPYFSLPPHDKNKDQYSIAFRFRPKKHINGDDLVFGNDFDHPIKDRLPPGFNTAFKIVKWVVDPGLDGDVYAEKPYLYGPMGSSVNSLYIGDKGEAMEGSEEEDDEEVGEMEVDDEAGLVVEEGGSDEGIKARREKGIPDGDAARKKWFLNENQRREWTWEAGREYGCDFYNPYLDFNDFALRLPGFTLPIMKYWDGQGLRKVQKRSHTLRYTLKNRGTGEVLFVVLFTLYLKEDVDENGRVKDGVEGGKPFELLDKDVAAKHNAKKNGEEADGEDVQSIGEGVEEIQLKENEKLPVQETNEDDVD